MTQTEFGHDANLTHEWVAHYRIPLVTSPWPSWSYEMALVVPDDAEKPADAPRARSLWKATWPSEEEASILGSAIDYRRSYYRDGHAQKMLERPLDVDGTVNTFILIRTAEEFMYGAGWRHRAASWQSPLFSPTGLTDPRHYDPTPEGLVRMLSEAVFGSQELDNDFQPTGRRIPNSQWLAHMVARPELFDTYLDTYTDLVKG